MYHIKFYFYYFIFLREYETKQCSNACNDISYGCQCVLEGDRIPSLKSHGQALKQECCLPGLFCDTGDAPCVIIIIIITIFIERTNSSELESEALV